MTDTLNPPPPSGLRQRLHSPLGRLVAIGLLLIVLMIPAGMISGVVQERSERRAEAVASVVDSWGGAQTVTGPVLRVPYVVRRVWTNAEGKRVEEKIADVAYFLPSELTMDATVKAHQRSRGIFQVPVYVTTLQMQGRFAAPDFSGWNVLAEDIDWSRAELMLGLSLPRGLHADSQLTWNKARLALEPSTGQAGLWNPPGVHATLGKIVDEGGAEFSISLHFNGAEVLNFSPTAEETHVNLQADWPHPSFTGGWLPVAREVSKTGFSSKWSVSYLGRDYPQRWRDTSSVTETIGKSVFGVVLTDPVDQYSMADRVTKYALMTLVFTFAVIWLTEVLSGAAAHPIQYGFVGGALCLFGLLQLSFAEHFGFAVAFGVAALAVVLLVTLYCRAVLQNWRRALGVGGILSGLYGYLYTILNAEDYALLGGSVALFLGLAAAMYLTRRIDWSNSGK